MSFQTDLPAAEAFELHCYLDNNAIPNKIYVDDGELEDNLGKYYLPSLVERVEMLIAKLTPTSIIKSEITWNPLDLDNVSWKPPIFPQSGL